MTARELSRLIASYRWLAQEKANCTGSATANGRFIEEEIDEIFLKIIRSPIDDPEVCCLQVDFLVSVLAEPDHEAEVRSMLRDAVVAHVRRLADRASRKAGCVKSELAQ